MATAPHAAGYQAALDCERDIDWHLARRGSAGGREFERGWFDALEDLSDFQMAAGRVAFRGLARLPA
ncbi:hypothetical protein [Mycolicibacterium sphagni]|uniref:hypothetical protein n=1 Tax=Mycolicibacterium sphagni TaxID=1786 RepID=UPI0021F2B6CE|nr:hypothetical protein [Mycolicibacterium sphagni]MCV7174814.1 hypothetical protein [Mycolicibacterium sphagni]